MVVAKGIFLPIWMQLHQHVEWGTRRLWRSLRCLKCIPWRSSAYFGGQDSCGVACRFWLPCHIAKMSWTLAILCSFLSTASFFISELFCLFMVTNSGLVTAKILLWAQANFLTMTCSLRVSPVVSDCLQPITSWPREILVSTPTPCGMIENMSHSTFERSAHFECVSSGWHYQSVMSGIQNALLISSGSEW
jgi:hypothetical protein